MHPRKLGEHFDAVQVLASAVNDDGSTSSRCCGTGNWYARIGMAKEFIVADQAHDEALYLASALCEEDEEDG